MSKKKKEYIQPTISSLTSFVAYSMCITCTDGSGGGSGYCGYPCDQGSCVN